MVIVWRFDAFCCPSVRKLTNGAVLLFCSLKGWIFKANCFSLQSHLLTFFSRRLLRPPLKKEGEATVGMRWKKSCTEHCFKKSLELRKVKSNHANQLLGPRLYPFFYEVHTYSNSFLREIFGICNMLYDRKVKLHIQITRRHLYALTARKMSLEFHMAVYNYRATFQTFLKVNNKSRDPRD